MATVIGANGWRQQLASDVSAIGTNNFVHWHQWCHWRQFGDNGANRLTKNGANPLAIETSDTNDHIANNVVSTNGANRWCQPLAPIIVAIAADHIIGDVGHCRPMFQSSMAPMDWRHWFQPIGIVVAKFAPMTPQNYWRLWLKYRTPIVGANH